jgi:hypothetical protein
MPVEAATSPRQSGRAQHDAQTSPRVSTSASALNLARAAQHAQGEEEAGAQHAAYGGALPLDRPAQQQQEQPSQSAPALRASADAWQYPSHASDSGAVSFAPALQWIEVRAVSAVEMAGLRRARTAPPSAPAAPAGNAPAAPAGDAEGPTRKRAPEGRGSRSSSGARGGQHSRSAQADAQAEGGAEAEAALVGEMMREGAAESALALPYRHMGEHSAQLHARLAALEAMAAEMEAEFRIADRSIPVQQEQEPELHSRLSPASRRAGARHTGSAQRGSSHSQRGGSSHMREPWDVAVNARLRVIEGPAISVAEEEDEPGAEGSWADPTRGSTAADPFAHLSPLPPHAAALRPYSQPSPTEEGLGRAQGSNAAAGGHGASEVSQRRAALSAITTLQPPPLSARRARSPALTLPGADPAKAVPEGRSKSKSRPKKGKRSKSKPRSSGHHHLHTPQPSLAPRSPGAGGRSPSSREIAAHNAEMTARRQHQEELATARRQEEAKALAIGVLRRISS